MALTGEPDAPVLMLIVGSLHGDEPAGLAITRRLRTRKPPPGVSLAIVDKLNPDGLARGTRQDARGVDLNRNFPFRWRPSRRGSRYYSGPSPLSEPESRLAVSLIESLRPDVPPRSSHSRRGVPCRL